RNRVKRVVREQFAALDPAPPDGTDVIVIARPSVTAYLGERGAEALGARLAELVSEATKAMAP
ncbi:MAG: ribonuclease P protein component, partial [Thermoleophilia bacterium]|nr:ribonuclease P protein component [Thermoleophilia bacterium]